MTGIKSFLRRHSVAIFCTLTILLSFACYLLPILHGEAVQFAIALVPTFVAIMLTSITEGGTGVHFLLGKLTQRRMSLKWLAIALAVALAMRLTISLVALILGWIPSIQFRPQTLVGRVLFALIFIVAASPEEVGWHGYTLPRLLQNHSSMYSSLIIGVFWGLVHLSLHLPGMPNEGLPSVLTLFQLIGLSVLITWLFIQGGNNIILTTVFHAAQSFFVIINHGVTLSQQAWLMATVFGATAVSVILTNRSM
jgi:membrane protease YdiL (CAAX protease family)